MHKRVPDTLFFDTLFCFPQVEKNKNSEIKIKLRKCTKECLTPFFLGRNKKMHKRVPDTLFYWAYCFGFCMHSTSGEVERVSLLFITNIHSTTFSANIIIFAWIPYFFTFSTNKFISIHHLSFLFYLHYTPQERWNE